MVKVVIGGSLYKITKRVTNQRNIQWQQGSLPETGTIVEVIMVEEPPFIFPIYIEEVKTEKPYHCRASDLVDLTKAEYHEIRQWIRANKMEKICVKPGDIVDFTFDWKMTDPFDNSIMAEIKEGVVVDVDQQVTLYYRKRRKVMRLREGDIGG